MNPWDILGTVIGWGLVAVVVVLFLVIVLAMIDSAVAKLRVKRVQAARERIVRQILGKNDG